MLSTNYKMGEKRIRLPFISCTSLRALISSSFTFRSKVFNLPLGNQNSPLAFAKMPSVMGQLPAYASQVQQPQSAVDFKESMGLPCAGCGHHVSMSLEARPL